MPRRRCQCLKCVLVCVCMCVCVYVCMCVFVCACVSLHRSSCSPMLNCGRFPGATCSDGWQQRVQINKRLLSSAQTRSSAGHTAGGGVCWSVLSLAHQPAHSKLRPGLPRGDALTHRHRHTDTQTHRHTDTHPAHQLCWPPHPLTPFPCSFFPPCRMWVAHHLQKWHCHSFIPF